jgi:diguanylate cyclase (GGDEF)-like protein
MLDHPTLIIAQLVLDLFYALIFLGAYRIYPNLKGISYLICGFLISALERTFYVLPPSAQSSHPYLFGSLGNYLSLIAVGLFYGGMLRHLASPRSPKLVWTTVSVAIVSAAILSAAQGRIFTKPDVFCVVCVALAVVYGVFAVELFQLSARRKLVRAFAVWMAMYALISLNHMFLESAFVHQRFSQQFIATLYVTALALNVLFSTVMSFFLLFVVGNSVMHNLETQSRTDSLTGVLNRRGIEEKLEEECAQSAREGRTFSVALIDVDHFKAINDQFGHAVGDSALRSIVEMALTKVRKYDYLGRFGGDEFLLILPSIDGRDSLAIVQRLCQSIKTLNLASDVSLSVSIGVAQYSPIDSVSTLLARADLALYKAKESGRGCAQLEMATL